MKPILKTCYDNSSIELNYSRLQKTQPYRKFQQPMDSVSQKKFYHFLIAKSTTLGLSFFTSPGTLLCIFLLVMLIYPVPGITEEKNSAPPEPSKTAKHPREISGADTVITINAMKSKEKKESDSKIATEELESLKTEISLLRGELAHLQQTFDTFLETQVKELQAENSRLRRQLNRMSGVAIVPTPDGL